MAKRQGHVSESAARVMAGFRLKGFMSNGHPLPSGELECREMELEVLLAERAAGASHAALKRTQRPEDHAEPDVGGSDCARDGDRNEWPKAVRPPPASTLTFPRWLEKDSAACPLP